MVNGIAPSSLAVWRPTANFGYPRGTRGQNVPDVLTKHIMAGWKRTLDDASWREPAGVGVHFGVGRDGSVSQYTNIFDASWANGVSGSIGLYDRSHPALAAWERLPGAHWIQVDYVGTRAYALLDGNGVNIPNSRSVATEREGFPDMDWTPAMQRAEALVDEWTLEEIERVQARRLTLDANLFVRHKQIDGVNRSRCPGENWNADTAAANVRALGAGGSAATEEEDEMIVIIADAANPAAKWVLEGGFKRPMTFAELTVYARHELVSQTKAIPFSESVLRSDRFAEIPIRPARGEGAFVQVPGNPTVWAIERSGGSLYRRSVADPPTFSAMGGRFEDVVPISAAHLGNIPERTPYRSVTKPLI